MAEPWTYTDDIGDVWTIDGTSARCSAQEYYAFIGVFGCLSANVAPLPVVAELLRRAGYVVTEPSNG